MNSAQPFISRFEEDPAITSIIDKDYDEQMQMNANYDPDETAEETQQVTRGKEPDYERDWESD